jgi:peptide/nickel transport system substrate-binding protein
MPAAAIFDSLMLLNEDGLPGPYMAESMEGSKDSRTWTLELRPDVRFHDGTTLDADAVIFNVNHHLDPANASIGFINAEVIESMEAVDGDW